MNRVESIQAIQPMTDATALLFFALASDAGNWSGMPPLDCNVKTDKASRGNLTSLKKLGLLKTDVMDGLTWVLFTQKGADLAQNALNIHIENLCEF